MNGTLMDLSAVLWKLRYARLCLRSRYEFTWAEAWEEACHSWDQWNSERQDGDPMPAPAEIIREDMLEWGMR